MDADLYFYTGTGNALWTARTLAGELGGAGVIPMPDPSGSPIQSKSEAIGMIFPVHIWGLPRRVIAFADALERIPSRYHFAVAVNAGQVAATLVQLENRMKARGLPLRSGFELTLPSNYIPWGGPGPEEEQRRRIGAARNKIKKIAAVVAAKEERLVEKGPLWQNLLFTAINRLSFSRIPTMDRSFWVDEKCDSCGICEAICPAQNVELREKKPAWLNRCEQCLACIQWCPQEAIQFGKKTTRYRRYHHPEVTLKQMLSFASSRRQQEMDPSKKMT